MAGEMIYIATTYIDSLNLTKIEGGHTEVFDSDYQIRPKDGIKFKDLSGFYHVVSVTINLKDEDTIIELLCTRTI